MRKNISILVINIKINTIARSFIHFPTFILCFTKNFHPTFRQILLFERIWTKLKTKTFFDPNW